MRSNRIGDEQDAVQLQLVTHSFSYDQMSRMRGIECASEDACSHGEGGGAEGGMGAGPSFFSLDRACLAFLESA